MIVHEIIYNILLFCNKYIYSVYEMISFTDNDFILDNITCVIVVNQIFRV